MRPTPPHGWPEIDETELRMLLERVSWRRDGDGAYVNDRTSERFAVRIWSKIYVHPNYFPE